MNWKPNNDASASLGIRLLGHFGLTQLLSRFQPGQERTQGQSGELQPKGSRPNAFHPHGKITRREAAEWLKTLSEAFAERNAQTEHNFVDLARGLRNLHTTATELSGLVSKRAGSLRSTLTESRIAGEGGLAACSLQELRAGLDETGALLQRLRNVENALSRLETQVHSIERIGTFLKSSVFSFAIESSRSPECSQAFGSFVEELRGLAARIGGLGETISEQTRATRSSEARGLQDMLYGLGETHKLAQSLETTAGAAAAEAQAVLDDSCATLRQAEERSRQIASFSGEAVYYMQFGDITRQKLEHVSMALAEGAELAVSAASESEFANRAAALECVAAIQAGQVESVREEILMAHDKLVAAFKGIGLETARLSAAIQPPDAAANAKSGGADALLALGSDMLRVEQLHHKAGESRQHARAIAHQAVHGCTQLAQHLDQVKAFNRDMHLQALNAIVKTAALGQQGATLEVLSMQMSWLFRESNQEVEGIIATIQNVLQEAQETAPTGDTSLDGAPPADGIDQSLTAGFEKITRAQSEFAQTSTEAAALLEKQGKTLGCEGVDIEFLADMARVLSEQLRDLGALRQVLGITKSSTAPTAQLVADLDQRYTMQGEREVHRKFAEAAAASGPVSNASSSDQHSLPDRISAQADSTSAMPDRNKPQSTAIVDEPTPVTAAPSPNPPDTSLGDNIELF